jgi:hypothetical protein
MELFNTSFSTKATDSRGVEIFRGSVIVGLDTGSISVLGDTLTDSSAAFPTSPSLKGRLLRDSSSTIFKIESNTTTSITVESGTPISGIYTVLADFPTEERTQQNFEIDIRTTVGYGKISNLVENISGSLTLASFENDELANLVFRDGAGNRFIIKSNTENIVQLFERVKFQNINLVTFTYNSLTGIVQYSSPVNLSSVSSGDVFIDSAGNKFLINSVNDGLDQIEIALSQIVDASSPVISESGSIVYNTTPVIGPNMSIFNSFGASAAKVYVDDFKIESEANARSGTGLLDNTFYYYTAFSNNINANVAQAEFSTYKSLESTQAFNISTKNKMFGTLLYQLWPSLYRSLDATEDLQDLMEIFGLQFNEIHSLIDTYTLQDTHKASANVLEALADQTGLASVGFSIGADTLRRIANDMLSAWKLKGSKEGIFLFIKIITTWDITDGTADISEAIVDDLPNADALRFYSSSIGPLNPRITTTSPFLSGGRFLRTLPGIVIPGFFTFREFVITIPNVALYVGQSEAYSVSSESTTMTDTGNNFGADNSLIGNFLLPNQSEVNDIFEIVANTATTITVKGIITNQSIGGDYAVLSPLNANRFVILNELLPGYIPVKTKAGFVFT